MTSASRSAVSELADQVKSRAPVLRLYQPIATTTDGGIELQRGEEIGGIAAHRPADGLPISAHGA